MMIFAKVIQSFYVLYLEQNGQPGYPKQSLGAVLVDRHGGGRVSEMRGRAKERGGRLLRAQHRATQIIVDEAAHDGLRQRRDAVRRDELDEIGREITPGHTRAQELRCGEGVASSVEQRFFGGACEA
jgi:hypothetical protein